MVLDGGKGYRMYINARLDSIGDLDVMPIIQHIHK